MQTRSEMAAVYSFEHSRSKSYSTDMRWRMVYQRLMSGLTYEQIDVNLNACGSFNGGKWKTLKRKPKYGNGNTEVRRKAAYRWPG